MLKAIIIEDEQFIMEGLKSLLNEIDGTIEITACISSVEEGLKKLSSQPVADIIFSDVQLNDGLSFEIFSTLKLEIPIVFITGYDQFILNAFEYNGIDYILKPVNKNDLMKAIVKYRSLQSHFAHNHQAIDQLTNSLNFKKRARIVVHRGAENISLKLEDTVLFYTENKIVFVVDKAGKKYVSDKNLTDLENELDASKFFRANRQYIINIDFIKSYKAFQRVKLLLDLSLETLKHSIVISQETAPLFRKWINEN